MSGFSLSSLRAFAREECGQSDLGNGRLDCRLLMLVEKMAAGPGISIPKAMGDWGQAKPAYGFFDNDDVTREKVIDPHYGEAGERLAELELVLVAQDSCFLNYTHHPGTASFRKIGTKAQKNQLRGVLIHSSLAVTAGAHRVLGLLDQQVIVREDYQASGERSKKTRGRDRESQKLPLGASNVAGHLTRMDRLAFVFDREGDVFEAIEEIQDLGARFVIRANHNRLLKEAEGKSAYLLDAIRKTPVIAHMPVKVAAGGRASRKDRPCRPSPGELRDHAVLRSQAARRSARGECPVDRGGTPAQRRCGA